MKKLILLAMLVATTNAYGYCRYDDNECQRRQAEIEQEEMRRDMQALRDQIAEEKRQREYEARRQ